MKECVEYPNGVVPERGYDVTDGVAECGLLPFALFLV